MGFSSVGAVASVGFFRMVVVYIAAVKYTRKLDIPRFKREKKTRRGVLLGEEIVQRSQILRERGGGLGEAAGGYGTLCMHYILEARRLETQGQRGLSRRMADEGAFGRQRAGEARWHGTQQ